VLDSTAERPDLLRNICKEAVAGQPDAVAALGPWCRAAGERMAGGDGSVRSELEELAYAVTYDLVESRVRRSYQFLCDRASVASVVHVAFLRLNETGNLFRDPSAILEDLLSLCRRLLHMADYALIDLVNAQRRRGRQFRQSEASGQSDDGSHDSPLDREPAGTSWDPQHLAKWTELHARVERLDALRRDVFVQHYYLDRPQKEIAEAMGLTAKQVSRMWIEILESFGDVLDPPQSD
jgi:DNA-directed RNA polymerase specialized sigma24 family protein